MDDTNIILSCGFTSKFKDIAYNKAKFICPVCQTHYITAEECFYMTRNKLVILKRSVELKKKDFLIDIKKIEANNENSKYYMDLCYKNLTNKIDIRREELKKEINQKIDEHYFTLLEQVDSIKQEKLAEYETMYEKTKSLKKELENCKIEDKNIIDQIDMNKNLKSKIEEGKKLLQSIEDLFKQPYYLFKEIYLVIDVKKYFGELLFRESESEIYTDNLDDNDFNRDKATIKLKIFNFKTVKEAFSKNSKKCTLRNINWSIEARSYKEKSGKIYLAIFLSYDSAEKLKELAIQVEATICLLHPFNSNLDLIRKFDHIYYHDEKGWGYRNFVEINEIMENKLGYYDHETDCITIQANLKVEIPQRIIR
ncbi:ubiquitin carboxyl-terminal hydrolase 7-like isoform X1 [Brachionus plicatilis]|uniref:Ubiquitin carboxyl-terminal hydrolase 7-like isoform X1 n=1 Tax=Brachionus plicatilis TaxID=10195 RepID=A0A3M7PWV8_BRAPC|nr:ubiquitin carboxyl-terminal hydrolase 7-like isoform X1 [Brachionus plicatilis]